MSHPIEQLPDEQQHYLIDMHVRARAAIEATLEEHGLKPGLSLALAKTRLDFLGEQLAPVVAAMEQRGTPVNCKAGCSVCCTLMVEATPDEIFALVQYLTETLSPEALEETKRRAVQNVARQAGHSAAERHRLHLFCPVLDRETGACRGHPARPTPCQGYFSLDRRQCEIESIEGSAPIPQPAAVPLMRDAVLAARVIVLEAFGLDQARVELTQGLALALADPDAEARWLAGCKVFADTKIPK